MCHLTFYATGGHHRFNTEKVHCVVFDSQHHKVVKENSSVNLMSSQLKHPKSFVLGRVGGLDWLGKDL